MDQHGAAMRSPTPGSLAGTGRAPARVALSRVVLLAALATALALGLLAAAAPSPAYAAGTFPPKTISAAASAAEQEPPDITATAAILIDSETGTVIFSKQPDERLPMASTTKIMTSILVLESLDLDQKVVVPKSATGTAGSLAGLMWGEVLTVEQLMYAMLIPSGNDAALTLAMETSGSVQAFVNRMNEKAEEMGLTNTHFANPNGLHLEDHYSSARDLATMAQYAMRDPTFRRVVDTPEYELPYPGVNQGVRKFKNSNALLKEYPWVNGVKTGSTPYAGYCMVASGSRDGVSLIAVLLGDADDDTRWKETKALLNYGMSQFPPTVLVDRGELVAELDVSDPLDRKVRLVSRQADTMRLCTTEVVTAQARLLDDVTMPVHVGDTLGVLDFTLDGAFLDSVPLVAGNSVEKPDIGEVWLHWMYAMHPDIKPA
jgi:D-alanyl-D-alanine carboxypeptidase (penicillin-binding protein 5/6)